MILEQDYLKHHGVPGQKHGRRLYQYRDGSLTPLGKLRRQMRGGAGNAKIVSAETVKHPYPSTLKPGIRKNPIQAEGKTTSAGTKSNSSKSASTGTKKPKPKMTMEEMDKEIARLKKETEYNNALKAYKESKSTKKKVPEQSIDDELAYMTKKNALEKQRSDYQAKLSANQQNKNIGISSKPIGEMTNEELSNAITRMGLEDSYKTALNKLNPPTKTRKQEIFEFMKPVVQESLKELGKAGSKAIANNLFNVQTENQNQNQNQNQNNKQQKPKNNKNTSNNEFNQNLQSWYDREHVSGNGKLIIDEPEKKKKKK